MGCPRGVIWNHRLLPVRLTGAVQNRRVFSLVTGSYDVKASSLFQENSIGKRWRVFLLLFSHPVVSDSV